MSGFFDKVVDGLNRGVSTVSENTKLFAEKANLSTQIKDIERDKLHLLKDIGTLVYNLHANGEIKIEQCLNMCDEVSAMEQRILELQERLKALETTKTQSMQYTQTTVAVEPVENGITCKCGFINKEGAKFCAKCGTQL